MPTFRNIMGHRRPIRILQSFLKTKAMPSALLFSGEEGIGKRFTAMILAQTLLCQHPSFSPPSEEGDGTIHASPDLEREGGDVEPCGLCLVCRTLSHRHHPDLFVLDLLGNKEGGDGRIKIDRIRAMQEWLIFEPMEAAWKVVVIDPADKMTLEAASSLLKTVEEPPPYTVLILIAHNPHRLLTTLRSRCQQIVFAPPSLDQVETLLMEQKGWTQEEARRVVAWTGGKLQALSLSVERARAEEEAFHALVKEETLSRYDTLFDVAAAFSKEAETFERALDYLLTYFRDLLLCSVLTPSSSHPSLLILSFRREELLRRSRGMEARDLLQLFIATATLQRTLFRNPNRTLALETLLLQMRETSSRAMVPT